MKTRRTTQVALAAAITAFAASSVLHAAEPPPVLDEAEILAHFQALVQIDSSDPPGREVEVTDYLTQALAAAGIEFEIFASEAHRPNVVARLRGNGSKRPLLLMAHTDTVNVDPAKWTFPPFSATRDGGYIYGRGTVDDKDNLAASLMVMLALKRSGIELDRDVIFLAEAGEEGSFHLGIEYMVANHFAAIDAEFCLAEGGGVRRQGGKEFFVGVQTSEKLPRALGLIAHGPAGHASVPLQTNAVVSLARAIANVADWQPPVRLSDASSSYFSQLARITPNPEAAARYRAILNPGSAEAQAALDYFLREEPGTAAILSSTISPTMIEAGYRINVIPSETRATLDTRLLPDEDENRFLAEVIAVVDDPAVDVAWVPRDTAVGASSPVSSVAYEVIENIFGAAYGAPVLPVTSTGATDMRFLRARGMQCYGVGPGVDVEDGPLGFGAHSDQERILEQELYRFARTYLATVVSLVAE